MANYLVVLFKNKTRKKIIKKFITLSRAKNCFKQLIKESDDVIFEVLVENGKECRFELGLIEMSVYQSAPVYMTDEFGRSVKVRLEVSGMSILSINPYKEEDLIYDVRNKTKITAQEFIKKYLKGDGLKMVSVLNNKVILQKDEEINLFSLKNESECTRFVESLSSYFFISACRIFAFALFILFPSSGICLGFYISALLPCGCRGLEPRCLPVTRLD
jgi:hypothetical protein